MRYTVQMNLILDPIIAIAIAICLIVLIIMLLIIVDEYL